MDADRSAAITSKLDHRTIFLNALSLRPGGSGVQTYGRELIRQLQPLVDGHLMARVQVDAVGELPPGVSTSLRPPCDGARRFLESLRPAPGGVGIIHSLDVDLPLRPRVPTVATVHDLSVFDVPWAFPGIRARAERRIVSQAIGRADSIITVSEFTASAVETRFGKKATVTRLAPSPDMVPPKEVEIARVRDRYNLPKSFVLHVGTIEPRKDVPRLIEACRRLNVDLVLAGASQLDLDPADAPSAQFLGYVPREDLPALYGAASVVAYPSVYEGFGLPPVEAMACGAVVVATAVGALPELARSNPGVPDLMLCPPGDTNALTIALEAGLNDEAHRTNLFQAGQAIVQQLSWASTAATTLSVYASLGWKP